MIMQVNIEFDELLQYFLIQYPTFPEILAICNSALALLMPIGIIARYFSGRLIREDLFLLFLQNMYQETYYKISQVNKQLFRSLQNGQQVIKSEIGQPLKAQKNQENTKNQEEDQIQIEDQQPVFIPQFKSRKSILSQYSCPYSFNNQTPNNRQEDEIIENTEQSNYKESESQISNKQFKHSFHISKYKNVNLNAFQVKKEPPTQFMRTKQINITMQSHLLIAMLILKVPNINIYLKVLIQEKIFKVRKLKCKTIKQQKRLNPNSIMKINIQRSLNLCKADLLSFKLENYYSQLDYGRKINKQS
ncbi:hypothetical protein ABPG72_015720 [Tetrahymena utriculariae]